MRPGDRALLRVRSSATIGASGNCWIPTTRSSMIRWRGITELKGVSRQRVPARSPWPVAGSRRRAHPGERPHPDVEPQPDLSGQARAVDPPADPRDPAAAPAARRVPKLDESPKAADERPRSGNGWRSTGRTPEVRLLPPADGRARLRPGELRRGGRWRATDGPSRSTRPGSWSAAANSRTSGS